MGANSQIRRKAAVLFIIFAFVVGGVVGWLATAGSASARTVPVMVASAPQSVGTTVNFQNGFAPVVRSIAGSVVNISSTRFVRSQRRSPFLEDPFFRQFFGDEGTKPRTERETSLGSGVIVNANGYILTNYHVVKDSSDVRVSLADKREFRGKVVGTDSRTDLAVVKIDATGLPVMRLGDSSKIEVGDFCLAVGDPFGLGQTVTSGIISATGRSGLGIEAYEDFIQTDAPINPGNSGGALVDVNGNLIGINTAILSGGGGNEGVGFAIPINLARQVMDQIIAHGRVIRAYMGIYPQEVDSVVASQFGLKNDQGNRGVLVGNVEDGSPASKAGIERGDILMEMNGQPITDLGQFRINIGMLPPGTTVKFVVFRNGKEFSTNVKLTEMPKDDGGAATQAAPPPAPTSVLDGISVTDLTPQLANDLGVSRATKGVVVTKVASDSPADDADLEKGDVIMEVNRQPVANVSEFAKAVRAAGDKPVLLLVDRQGTTMYLSVKQD
jgi:Do/DeqQ family serine protease